MDIICKECNEKFECWHELTQHLRNKHNIAVQKYYDKYIKKENDGICKICNKPTKFLGISQGYRIYCSTICKKADRDLIVKAEETSLQKYGITHYSKSSAWLESVKETNNKKFGTDFAGQNESVKLKAKNTCLIKYGTNTYSQTLECKEKVKQTVNERFNVDYLMQNVDIKHKSIQTCNEKYGVDNVSQVDSVKKKKILTNNKKYGVDWFNNHEKTKITNLERYGVENPQQVHDIRIKSQQRYFYNSKSFDSKWELSYYIWLKDNKVKFTYQPKNHFTYTFNNIEKHYFPDFIVDNQYVEIKGPQFFENGKLINPYDRTQDLLYNAKYQCMVDNNVKIITNCDIYLNYVKDKYGIDYLDRFKRTNIDTIYNNLGDFPYITYDKLSLNRPYNIIQTYHKSIWHANVYNKPAPVDAWKNKDIMYKVISNRLVYQKPPYTADKMRQGLNVTKLAPKVSVFKPELAKQLVLKYLNDVNYIFDPFSGFSGRLLGACSANKCYIGQDINQDHVKESNNIIHDFKLNANIYECDIFNSSGEYECLFTCPPYKNIEKWNELDKNLSCDEWIDECLERFKCKKYLFVVDNTEKYKDYIVETIENKSHFGTNYEYVIFINNIK